MTLWGNLPVGAPDDGYARLVRLAREAGVPVALDARDEALLVGVSAGPHVVKVNAEEAGALPRTQGETLGGGKGAAQERRGGGEGGGRGAILAPGGGGGH